MDIIRFAIDNPVKVTSCVILLVLFGLLSFLTIPVQLTPDVDRPVISVMTRWPGASPQEIEREIIDRQEEKLKSVTDLRRMTSTSQREEGSITLEFNVGVDKDNALRDTIEKINQVASYPEDVERPAIAAAESAQSSEIAWLIFKDDTGLDVSTRHNFVKDNVLPLLDRVPGVGSTDAYGGREREVQVQVDPALMAARSITARQLQQALQGQNTNISAGTLNVGKRQMTYRTVGEYREVADVENTVVAYDQGGPVFVRDVADVVITHKKQYSFVKSMGEYCLAIPIRRETGANVITTMDALQVAIKDINKNLLNPRGMSLTQVYDETVYIHSAIDLVVNNIFLGGLLATAVLILFLRSATGTLVVAVAIPISVIGTFLIVTLLGRNLNVVMLAGMAFAVGMVVDNAVVVLENIYRHRQLGADRAAASYKGSSEVWGAILASTLTTIAVFLPVIFVEEEAGQLFRDIAIAIASAVFLSLLVAITVIPALSSRILGEGMAARDEHASSRFGTAASRIVSFINERTTTRIAVVVVLTAISIIGSSLLAPPASYLPTGNRNFVFGFLIPPPGYSIDEFKTMGESIEQKIRPFWEAQADTEEAQALPKIPMPVGIGDHRREVIVQAPPVENFFYAAFNGMAIMGCFSQVEGVVNPLVNILNQSGQNMPGSFASFSQVPLFGDAFTGGDSVELELRCDNEEKLNQVAGILFGQLMQKYDYPNPDPASFNIGRPEIQAIVDRVRAADLQLNVADLGFSVATCVNGAYVGSFIDQGDEIDLVIKVKGMDEAGASEIAAVPIAAPTGNIIPLGSVVDLHRTFEPQQIRHSESTRSIKFAVSIPAGMALEETMRDLQNSFIAPLRQSGVMTDDVIVSLEGNADKLVQTQRSLVGNFTGLFTSPSLFSMSPKTSLMLLIAAALALGVILYYSVSPRWAILATAGALAVLSVAVLLLNIQFTFELLQSRAFLALFVTYLLMAALFESFVYPLVIMLSVPLAMVGGFAGLAICHWFTLQNPVTPIQQLDVLTMLGFIILVGIVVNNAILIVHQALNNMRDSGMQPNQAISASVRTRVRPIFMTALTSIGGMIPLVVMPGSGSELYRGLGSVMVGGLFISTVFTLVLVPAMFSLFVDLRVWIRHALGVSETAAPEHLQY